MEPIETPSVKITTTSPQEFENLTDAISVAGYVEQILNAEHQWMINRLGWLLISQSFLMTAYAVLVTSGAVESNWNITLGLLRLSLPFLGVTCCVLTGIAIIAAAREGQSLADERARLALYINERSPANVPLEGIADGLRDRKWTLRGGDLPHYILPWLFAMFWCILFIASAADQLNQILN